MKSTTQCLVQSVDYDVHWGGGKAPAAPAPPPAPAWDGVERRVGLADRRVTHDRRWSASAGRRFRAADRRRKRRVS